MARDVRWRSVHLACHGLLEPGSPLFSSLALSPDPDHDGYLTALEVFGLKVNTDLVVLSACDTGRGQSSSSEGMVGLARSFLHAGAPRVIASLWKVDDEATQALMRRFYELWNAKPAAGTTRRSVARALREAQAWVASQPRWKAPYYWAAWVVWSAGH